MRIIIILLANFLLAVITVKAQFSQHGELDTTFNFGRPHSFFTTLANTTPGSGANSTVYTIAFQPDGKVLIGGDFTTYNGIPCNRIARLNADGTLDTTFKTGMGPNNRVNTISLQPNGKVLIGGHFSSYNGTTCNRIARLNANGSLDFTFNSVTGANSTINTLVLQPDGKVLIGGFFTSYNGTAINRIARLNTDGNLDVTFNPDTGASSTVYSTALQPDGKIIIGGDFSSYNSTTRNRIARLNADGSLDTTFNPGTGANNTVFSITLQPDGKVLIGGVFTSYNGTPGNIARLNADGSLDTTFIQGTVTAIGITSYAYVASFVLQPDGKILIGGIFTKYNGTTCNYIARLNADGSLDATFNLGTGTGANNTVRSFFLQPNGKVLIGGSFTNYNGTTCNRIARLNADGSLDVFNPVIGANNIVRSIVLQSNGKVLVGGDFSIYNGSLRNNIARLNANGSLDFTFNPGTGANNIIYSIAVQSDGKVLIGGNFTSYNGTARNRIARLNADGSLDATFNPGTGANGSVYTTALQPDGKVIICGNFNNYNGTAINRIARLNADGSLDATFNPGTGANNTVYSTAQQPDDKLLIGGEFTSYNGTAINRIARLNADGSLDVTFNPGTGANFPVNSIAIQPDDKVLLGGDFSAYNGTSRNRIARLNADGSLDVAFNQGTGASGATLPSVKSLVLQPDGKLLIGGGFTSFNGVFRPRIARIHSPNCFTTLTNTTDTSAICDGDIKILTGTSGSSWFIASGPGSITDTIYTASGAGNVIIYNGLNGCFSPLINFTVNPLPSAPLAIPTEAIYPGYTATITPTPAAVNYRFYDTAIGGTPLAGGNGVASFTTPPLSNSTTYYVDALSPQGCKTSPRMSVVFMVDSNAPVFGWAKAFGRVTGNDSGNSVTVDAFGNVYSTGSFSGTADFDPGPGTFNLIGSGTGDPDIYVQKLDASGNFLWARSFGAAGTFANHEFSNEISVDASGNVYITGAFVQTADFNPGSGTFNVTSAGEYDIFVLKLSSSGGFLWVRTFGGTGIDIGKNIKVDDQGNVYTIGNFIGTVDFDPGVGTENLTSVNGGSGFSTFILKLNASGDFIWAKSLDASANNVYVDGTGNVYTIGDFSGTVDFDPGTGISSLSSLGDYDIFIHKLDASGNFLWARAFGGPNYQLNRDKATSITVDASGNVYTIGYFGGTVDFDPGAGTYNITSSTSKDFFVQKLDASGNFIWAKTLGLGSEDISIITLDTYGHLNIGGKVHGNADFYPGQGTINLNNNFSRYFWLKIDTAGNYISANNIFINPEIKSFHTDAIGNIYGTGKFNGTVDFDPGSATFNLTGQSFYDDAFVFKFGNTAPPCHPSYSIDSIEACYSYTWIDGNTYTASNNSATIILTNSSGCDSIVSLNLTINYATTSIDTQFACGYFIWIDGNTYTENNNTATITLTNSSGCDSVVTLNLIFEKLPLLNYQSNTFGGTGNETGNSIKSDSFGYIYTIGNFEGTVDFDPGAGIANLTSAGSRDIFVQKLDASGNFIWAKSFGGTSDDIGMSLAVDNAGNVYTTGAFRGVADFDPGVGNTSFTSLGSFDIFVQKLDASGNFLWAKSFGGTSDDIGRSITVDANGNVYTTGEFRGTTDFDPGAGTANLTTNGINDVFIQKLDTYGNFIWAKSFGGHIWDTGLSIDVDASGNVYTAGFFREEVDFDPGPGIFKINSVSNSFDIFVHKLDASGNFVWVNTFGGGLSSDTANSIIVDHSSNVYITGVIDDDYSVIKINSLGTVVWVRSFGGTNSRSTGYGITLDATGNIYTIGTFTNTVDFDPSNDIANISSVGGRDIFLHKLNPHGNFLWAKSFGNTSSEHGYSIHSDNLGNIYATGQFLGTVDFNPGAADSDNKTAIGNNDAFVLKWSELGCTSTSSIDTQIACNSFTWIDGITYFESNDSAKFILVNTNCCDSIVTLNLIINNSTTTTDTVVTCSSYTWIDGNTYTSSNNNAIFTLTNAVGCDSVITLNLSIIDTANLNNSFITNVSSFSLNDGAIDIDVSGNAPLSFNWSNGATTEDIFNLSEGAYNLTVTDTFACTSLFTFNVLANSSTIFVWPGDANDDLIADNNDLLPIGLYYGLTGTARDSTSNLWIGHSAYSWNDTMFNGANLAHADCNGDGIINDADTLAINLNYGLTHVRSGGAQSRAGEPLIQLVPNQSIYLPGDTAIINIVLGDVNNPVQNLYGLSFDLSFDYSLAETGSVQLVYSNSLLGNIADNLKLSKIASNNGKIFGAITKKNQQNADGYGTIAQLKFIAKNNTGIPVNSNIDLSNYFAITANADTVVFDTQNSNASFTIDAVTSVPEKNNQFQLMALPNPYKQSTIIQYTLAEQSTTAIKIYDVLGKVMMQTEEAQQLKGTYQIPFTNENSKGIYLVVLTVNGNSITKRIVQVD